jgi:hypothetical protein
LLVYLKQVCGGRDNGVRGHEYCHCVTRECAYGERCLIIVLARTATGEWHDALKNDWCRVLQEHEDTCNQGA